MAANAIIERLDRIDADLKEIRRLLLSRDREVVSPGAPGDGEGLISTKEAAQLLQISIQEVYTKCAQGELPHRKVGKAYKFEKTELLGWIRKQQPGAPFSIDDFVDRYLQQHTRKR